MTEPKFTKGPYRVGVKESQGTEVYSAVHCIKVGSFECTSFFASYIIDPDEAYANACLFAASSELYDELARIDPNNPVLAKARGE